MKAKAQHQFISALAIATLLVAGGFWAKISMGNRAQTIERQPVVREPAVDAVRQILSVLPVQP